MAIIADANITANGDTLIQLKNSDIARNIYTVYATGTFGSGTLTALLISKTGATAAAILDASGAAISLTAGAIFNFEAQSSKRAPYVTLKITLAGATNPDIDLVIANGD